MKIKIIWCVIMVSTAVMMSSVHAQTISTKDITGAWGFGPATDRTVMINTDKVFSVARYDIPGKKL